MKIMEEYPHQGVWLFMSVVQSKKAERNRRGEDIISKIMVDPFIFLLLRVSHSV